MILEEIIRNIIYEKLDVGGRNGIKTPKDIKLSHKIEEDLGADSLDLIELIMAFEEHFGIDIPDAEVGKIITVEDCFAYATKHFKAS